MNKVGGTQCISKSLWVRESHVELGGTRHIATTGSVRATLAPWITQHDPSVTDLSVM